MTPQRAHELEAELRAVAAEMRNVRDASIGWPGTVLRMLTKWSDEIDPPAPEPLKSGDRVRVKTGYLPLTIRAIDRDEAWVEGNDPGGKIVRISSLERIP